MQSQEYSNVELGAQESDTVRRINNDPGPFVFRLKEKQQLPESVRKGVAARCNVVIEMHDGTRMSVSEWEAEHGE